MQLQSTATIVVALLVTLAIPIAMIAVWNRLSSSRWLRGTVRLGLLVTSQLLAVLLAALVVNDHYDFYTSWSELFGTASLTTTTGSVSQPSIDQTHRTKLLADYHAGRGTVVPLSIPGVVSGVPARPAFVYLPAQYGNPSTRNVRYPVLELLPGVPGNPGTWTHALNVASTLDTMINARESLPFIAVIPTDNVLYGRDLECLNVVNGGPQVDTYLTTDVQNAVEHAVRASTASSAWGLMGISAGGYCAMNLAMRHPNRYTAAVSLSGYTHPSVGSTNAGSLLGDSTVRYDENSPSWEARHWTHGAMSILAISSRQDGPSFRSTIQLLHLPRRPGLTVDTVLLASGGHNTQVWSELEPVAFNWLSRHLTAPLADVRVTSGLTAP